jgi:hypothetical protein
MNTSESLIGNKNTEVLVGTSQDVFTSPKTNKTNEIFQMLLKISQNKSNRMKHKKELRSK